MVNIRATVDLTRGMTKAQLLHELAGVPDQAVITPIHTQGHRLWESATYHLEFVWAPKLKDSTDGPHTRACGVHPHHHGPDCHFSCPTCGGKAIDSGEGSR